MSIHVSKQHDSSEMQMYNEYLILVHLALVAGESPMDRAKKSMVPFAATSL